MINQLISKASAFALGLAALAACSAPAGKVNPAIAPDPDVEAKVEKVLKGMTHEEKAGQMVQLSILLVQDETGENLDRAKLEKIIGEY